MTDDGVQTPFWSSIEPNPGNVCPVAVGGHFYRRMYRFDWPFGVLLPKVTQCAFCGARP